MKKARPTNPPAVSRERTLYLRRKRRRTHLVHACQIGFLVFFFAQWEISARLGWIDSFILSQPSRILETLRNMSQNHLMMHVGVTLYETLTGFVLGVLQMCIRDRPSYGPWYPARGCRTACPP